MPDFIEISLDLTGSTELPDKVVMAVSGILSAESASRLAELESLENTWDGEKRSVSKHSESLIQMDNGVRIPPSGWKCQNCDMREGLWLNLTDGSIGCGRKYFDGTGGNNHAAEHYDQTKYPLVVKLGTITPNGADVYSYDEDAMVLDPNLDKHLAHFGINISDCRKTEKSMLEMERQSSQRLNTSNEFKEIVANAQMVPILRENNVQLKTQLNQLERKCQELMGKLQTLETKEKSLQNLNQKNEAEAVQVELLRKDLDNWKAKAQSLSQQLRNFDADSVKRLMTEKTSLSKQVRIFFLIFCLFQNLK